MGSTPQPREEAVRIGRAKRPPAYLNDYVCEQIDREKPYDNSEIHKRKITANRILESYVPVVEKGELPPGGTALPTDSGMGDKK